jgi:hypothetical protein
LGYEKNTNRQAPTSREAANFNIQSEARGAWFGAWTLEVSLGLGGWCLVLCQCHSPSLVEKVSGSEAASVRGGWRLKKKYVRFF